MRKTPGLAELATIASLLAAAVSFAACGDDEATGSAGAGGSAATPAATSGASGDPGATTGDGGTGPASSASGGEGGSTSTGATSSSGSGGSGGGPPAAACSASSLPPPDTDCDQAFVRCVGEGREHATIQEAADQAVAGDVVVVAEGTYAGFQIDASGTPEAPITFVADGTVTVDAPAPTGDGIRFENVSHVRLIGFSVEDVPERCIAARGASPEEPMVGLWIIGNRCRGAGVEGFYLSEVSQSRVELNDIADTGIGGSTRSHGIYLANAGADGTTLRGNSISGATPDESNGIHFNGDLSVGGDGIISGLVVESNVVWGNAQNGFNLDGVQDSVFRNNVVFANGRHALRAYAIDGAQGPAGLVVVANTLLTDVGWPLRLTEDLGGHVVFDNILLTDDPNAGSIAIEDGVAFSSASNAVVDRFSADGEESLVDLAEWQALGYDAGSFVTSPGELFVAPGSDFQLLPGAPAVDAGLPTFLGQDAPATDVAGTPRPSGAGFDIGAYERP
jgi:hypothetical protein